MSEECDLCGDAPASHWAEVQHEDTGELREVDLCDDCDRDLRDYNRGVDVEWNV